jgi:hypothetical protein
MVWHDITGHAPPGAPPTARAYTKAGLPWFEYYAEDNKALEGSSLLQKLKSVATLGKEKGDVPLPENTSVDVEKVIELRKTLKRDQVREGVFWGLGAWACDELDVFWQSPAPLLESEDPNPWVGWQGVGTPSAQGVGCEGEWSGDDLSPDPGVGRACGHGLDRRDHVCTITRHGHMLLIPLQVERTIQGHAAIQGHLHGAIEMLCDQFTHIVVVPNSGWTS